MDEVTCIFSDEVTARQFYGNMKETGRNPSEPVYNSKARRWLVVLLCAARYIGS